LMIVLMEQNFNDPYAFTIRNDSTDSKLHDIFKVLP
jgi:hypothetical protein